MCAHAELHAEHMLRAVRAAEAGDDSQEAPATPEPLSRDEITAKLNSIPTFAMLNADDSMVTMVDDDGGDTCL
eukprot:1306459-Prymnesium_polylepis.1